MRLLGKLRSGGRSSRWLGAAAVVAVTVPLAAAMNAPAASTAAAGDSPRGFWYGTDSWPMPVTGTGPYSEPSVGGSYGGYVGMVGNWARWQGCGGVLAWSPANFSQAAANFTRYHKGVGTAGYWFMAGPGVDPHYNGTASEAKTWGKKQAARALEKKKRRVQELEAAIATGEKELDVLRGKLKAAPGDDWEKLAKMAQEEQALQKKVDSMLVEWARLSEEIA